jgi:hypothetical protein
MHNMNTLTKEEQGYDLVSLKALIDRRKNNIALFEKAIQDEMAAIRYEQNIISILEEDAKKG